MLETIRQMTDEMRFLLLSWHVEALDCDNRIQSIIFNHLRFHFIFLEYSSLKQTTIKLESV
jgi:hypothetical protein